MFIVSRLPDWAPGANFDWSCQSLEEAQDWVRTELADRAADGIDGAYYIREVNLGGQFKYTSDIVVNINATTYPEEV